MSTAPYERDFYLWTQRQAAELRRAAAQGSNLPLDWENLAEEIESLGARDRRELASRLEQVLLHLLKLRLSPAVDPRRGWRETIQRERSEIELLLADSPSLRGGVPEALAKRWPAVRRAAAEALTGEIAPAALPAGCPFSVDQVLDPDFWPEPVTPP